MLDPLWMITSNCIIPVRLSMFSHITHTQCQAFFIFHNQRPHPQSLFQLKINKRKNILFDFNKIAVHRMSCWGFCHGGVTFTHQCLITCQFVIGFVFCNYVFDGNIFELEKLNYGWEITKKSYFWFFPFIPFCFISIFIRTLQNTYYKKRTPLL